MKNKIVISSLMLSSLVLVAYQNGQSVNADEVNNQPTLVAPSQQPLVLNVTAHYTNGLPIKAGEEIKLRNLTPGSTQVISKTADANGMATFTEKDGLNKTDNYSVETAGVKYGYTVRYGVGGVKNKDILVNLPGGEDLLILNVTAHYTNGLPVAEGTEVKLRNLSEGSTQVITKTADVNGMVTFSEKDGLNKTDNYSVETAGVKYGYTVRYGIGGVKNKDILVNLPGAEEPLVLNVTAHYTNGLPVTEGTEVKLRNLSEGSTQVITKTADANGMVTFSEKDGLNKTDNYSIETAGVKYGYTVRYGVGGVKNKDITVELPQVAKEALATMLPEVSEKSEKSDVSPMDNSAQKAVPMSTKAKSATANISSTKGENSSSSKVSMMKNSNSKNMHKQLPQTGEKNSLWLSILGVLTTLGSLVSFKKAFFK